MSDDTSDRSAADRSRISLSQPWEVKYWTEALGISEQELRDVVGRVGNSADAVRAALRS